MIYVEPSDISLIKYFDKCVDKETVLALLKIKQYNLQIGVIKDKANSRLRKFIDRYIGCIKKNSSIPDGAYNVYHKTSLLNYIRLCLTEDEFFNIIKKIIEIRNESNITFTTYDSYKILKTRGYRDRDEYKVEYKNVFSIGSRILIYDSIYDSTYDEYPTDELLITDGLKYTKSRALDSYYHKSSYMISDNFLENIDTSNYNIKDMTSIINNELTKKYILKIANKLEDKVFKLLKNYDELDEYLSTLEF